MNLHFIFKMVLVIFLVSLSILFPELNSTGQTGNPAIVEKEESVWNLEKIEVGSLPLGWKAEATNLKNSVAKWEVIKDSTAPFGKKVLALTGSENSGEIFNICWINHISFKEGELTVNMIAVRGNEDQGGGLIWRVQDKNNYYVARFNPLEDNFRLYYVKGGRRTMLASSKTHVPGNRWNKLKVVHRGNHIEAYLDDQKLLDTHDDTFLNPGGIGLWSKADAVSSFDNLSVKIKK